MIAYVFPGQGSQKKGMGKDVFELFPEVLAQADALLGYSLKTLCLSDPLQKLNNTLYTQPALYVVNALHYMAECAVSNVSPVFGAGHSLGEYNALFAAGVISFEDGLRLVQKRALLMSQAVPGRMAAVIGLDTSKIYHTLRSSKFESIEISNLNTPLQTVISGKNDEILEAKIILENIPHCRRVVMLPVSGAFHSQLMKQAKIEFEEFVAQFSFGIPKFPVISNVTALPYNNSMTKILLAKQITHPVNWVGSIYYMLDHGVKNFKELGPGKVLTGLINKISLEERPSV